MHRLIKLLAVGFCSLALAPAASAQETPVLKAAVLKVGTVNWELETIKQNSLDTQNGFQLEVMGMAGNPATRIAFQGGEADIVVADWLWVARQRADGHDYVFVPYSKSVGGLMVPKDSQAKSLNDLVGQKIGIAGGPVDKSWLILRAYAEQEYGLDLAAETEQVFGAPPLIFKSALSGETAGAINFWHFAAKMKAKGMRELISVSEAAKALGLNPDTPLLGYVFHGKMLKEQPDLVRGFMAASRGAKDVLANDPTAFDKIRPMMRAKSDADFEALKAGFIAGIPAPGPVNEEQAEQMLEVMGRLGGEKLVGSATSLPEGVFVVPEG
ncbi:ABC transporter substrate-binding protein [Roseibium porphyridii]|uniref:ABC transporter substrate-binding protein n=1 Tax=Roseibium porphyridii TaxID=2866279 RepID=A0ABY8F6K7_9HYPH|nr:ABC transporter substrate-binding protein [Roseibium sp. KMA01]WFE88308.1 ABC transporter substrate-binding protein [Roseibium sp. KMA01]